MIAFFGETGTLRARRVLAIAIAGVATMCLSCDDTPVSESTYREIKVGLAVVGTPLVDAEVVVTCQYEVVYPDDKIRTWFPAGRIRFAPYEWEYVSGDTAWVDTLQTGDKKERSVRLRVVGHGLIGLDAQMIAPPAGDYEWPLTGTRTLLVNVP